MSRPERAAASTPQGRPAREGRAEGGGPGARPARLALAALLGLAVALAAAPASADVRTEARRHFRDGMALVAQGRIDEGIAELLQAYEILPHPNVLYNVARAYAESGRYERAVEYFERYLESDPPDRAEVNGFLRALHARIEAIEAREHPREAPPEEPEEAPPPAEPAPSASEEEIAALEDSATQIEALAEATASEALRRRAEALRGVARALRERNERYAQAVRARPSGEGAPEGSEGAPPEEGAPEGGAEEGAAGSPEEDASLLLGRERQGDTYEETIVSSSRAAQSPLDAPNATTIITAQDIRLSGLYANYGETLRRVPGMDLMTTSPNNVQFSVRGLNQRLNNRAIVLVDGRSVYLDFVGGQIWSLIPVLAEDIERIEVIRGPASALYGADAFTGVVNILTRQLGEGRSFLSSGLGSHGQYRLAASVTRRVDRVRFRLSGGFENANLYSRAVGPSRVDVTPYARDPELGTRRLLFSGEAQLRLGDGYTVRAGTGIATGSRSFQGLSRLRELYLQDALFTQTYVQANTAFGLSGRVFWNRFSADFGSVQQREGGLEAAQAQRVDRQDIVDVELLYTNSFDIADGIHNQLIAGLGYRFKEIDWPWVRDPLTGSTVRTQHHGNLFLQDTLRIHDVVQIVLSARGDLHPLFPEPQISPRGSVLFHPTPRQSVRLSAGTAFRSPTFVESYAFIPNSTPVRGVTALGIGDDTMNPERIASVELGYMLQEFDAFSLELTGYYNLVFDEILLSRNQAYRLRDFVQDPRAAYDSDLAAYPLGQLQFANEDADFQQIGGEVGVRLYPVDGLDIYLNYAIHETSPLGDTAQLLEGRALDQRTSAHKINAGVQYRSPFGLDLAVDFHWVSDQVWVEQVLDTERGGTAFVPFELPAYAVMNARAGWRLLDDQLEISVVGTNLLMDGHREHPFGQRVDRRVMGHVTLRF